MVPTLCVVTQSGTLQRPKPQSGSGCIPTQSVGTMSLCFGEVITDHIQKTIRFQL
jgi:hypothetical protein